MPDIRVAVAHRETGAPRTPNRLRVRKTHGRPVVLTLHGHTFLGSGKGNRRLVRYSLGAAWEPYAGIPANEVRLRPL